MIALLRNERGADVVGKHVRGALISTVNVAEVIQRMVELGLAAEAVLQQHDRLEIEVSAFTRRQAEITAALRQPTRDKGLALGDRACLALALDRGLPVLTAETAWLEVETKADVRLIRERQDRS